MADTLKEYPRGSVAMGSGDLASVSNLKVKFSNGAKLVHTIRESPSGVVRGHKEVSGTFDVVVDSAGEERDWWGLVKSGEVKQFRVKMPGEVKNIAIASSDVDLEIPSDGPISETVAFVGKWID